jgi:hypothetical protein
MPQQHSPTFILVLLISLLFSANAFATGSRINSMGGGSKAITVDDDSNLWVFPSTIVDWGNRVLIDRFDGTKGEFGLHYGLSQDMVLVVYGGDHADRSFRYGGKASDLTGCGLACDGNGNTFKGAMGFGWNAGGGNKYGVILSIHGDNQTTQLSGSDTQSKGPLGMGIGLGSSFGDLDMAMDLIYGALNDQSKDVGGGDGHFEMGIVGRYTSNVAPGVDAIPYLAFDMHSKSVKSGGSITNDSSFGFDLGSDLKIQPANDIYIYPGVGLSFAMATAGPDSGQSETTTFIFPYFGIGLDAKINEWLDFRMGASQHDSMVTTEACPVGSSSCESAITTKNSDVALVYTAGFGLHFADLTVDMNLNPQFFNNGLYMVNGQTTGPFGLDIALRYSW